MRSEGHRGRRPGGAGRRGQLGGALIYSFDSSFFRLLMFAMVVIAVSPTEKARVSTIRRPRALRLGGGLLESLATPGADLRHRHHRRRRQRLRNCQGRRRTRLVGLSLRKGRSRLLDLQRFEQAHSWRPALFGAFQVSFGSRGAHRARGSVANRAPYRLAASLCAAPPCGSQTRVVASNRPFSLRPSWRAPAVAANPNPAIGR